MTLDLDTFLVALYTIVDDLYREHFARLFILEGGNAIGEAQTSAIVRVGRSGAGSEGPVQRAFPPTCSPSRMKTRMARVIDSASSKWYRVASDVPHVRTSAFAFARGRV